MEENEKNIAFFLYSHDTTAFPYRKYISDFTF